MSRLGDKRKIGKYKKKKLKYIIYHLEAVEEEEVVVES